MRFMPPGNSERDAPSPPEAGVSPGGEGDPPATREKRQTFLQEAARHGPQGREAVAALPEVESPRSPGVMRGPRDRLSMLKELFMLIEMAVKTLNLYEGRGESCEAAEKKAFEHLRETVRQHGELEVAVRPFEFYLGMQRVYTTQEDRQGITYRIFRDGIRKITFTPAVDRGELRVLLDTLRAIRPSSADGAEHDSVTRLWEQNLQGIRYEAVDYFLEGTIRGSADDLQEQVTELFEKVMTPLHASPHVRAAEQVLKTLRPEVVEQTQRRRADSCATLLSGFDVEKARRDADERRAALPTELWRRSMTLITRLLEAGSPGVADLLVQVIEQLMLAGRWEMLDASCKTLAEHLEQARAGGDAELPRRIRGAMGRLCEDDKLLVLHDRLVSCSAAEFERLVELMRILPREADPQLLVLLRRLPDGEVQKRMLEVLTARGVDLTDFLRQQLRGKDTGTVIGAVHDLGAIGTGSAIAALKSVTGHAEPAVRLAVFQTLGENVGESLVPRLLDSLRLGSVALREHCLDHLERVGARRHGRRLLAMVNTGLGDDWPPGHHERLLRLLVGCGGEEVDAHVIGVVTVRNPFRRSAPEKQREQMLKAVFDTGGERARRLLDACLQKRLPRRVRSRLEAARETVGDDS
jgi:hypothetical protein